MTTPSDLRPVGEPQEDGTGSGRRLHPLTPLFASLTLGRILLPQGFVAYGVGGMRLLVAFFVVQLVARTVAWHRRVYRFDGEVLRIDSGVFSRNQELIPARRIQQVNLVEKLYHRVVGVATLRVETAGGGAGAAVSLDVVSIEEAHRLRDALLAAKARAAAVPSAEVAAGDDASAPAWVPAPWTVAELGYRQLAIAGVTGGELLVIFASLASLFTLVDGLPDQLMQRLGGVDVEVGPALIALGVVAFGVLWLGSAAGTSILRNAGYRLVLVGDELHVERGLLERKQGAIPLARIQAVRIDASPLRRWLGLVSVRFQSAGRASAADESRIDVPVLGDDEVDRVLALTLPGSTPVPVLRRPPRAALQRAVLRRVVPTTVLAVPLVGLAETTGAAAGAVAIVLSVLWGIAAYRALGHAVGNGFLYTRSGAVVRRMIVVPTVRAQSGDVRRSPFQRRVGLATLVVDLAGPGDNPRVVDEAAPVATEALRRVMADVGGVAGARADDDVAIGEQ